ncbi:MAG: class II aldolase/adducin family protein [Phycisphaerales bacterium]|nr:MAG: class II aldolase/adducin family protein [Phycisphaerales bacterium]
MPAEWQLRRKIVDIARRVHAQGFVAATDGNISARAMGDRMFITPSGTCLGELNPADLLYLDFERRVLAGRGRPSSELALHIEVYHQRPDVQAVIHAHPPVTNAFSFAGLSLADPVIPEVVVAFGAIPTTEYATPSSEEGPMVIRGLIRRHDVLILQRHGSLTVGADLSDAYHKLEKLEHAARTLLAARQLGSVRELSPDELDRLATVAEKLGYGRSRLIPPSSP